MKNILLLSAFCFVCISNLGAQTATIEQAKQAALAAPTSAENHLKVAFSLEKLAAEAFAAQNMSLYAQYSYEAADYFQLAIAAEPKNATTYQRIGLHYQQAKHLNAKQKSQAAIQYLQTAEAIQPNAIPVLEALSKAYADLGLPIKATEFQARTEFAKKGVKNTAYHKL
jgi:tetratricopeptide (TPR) repeat protein